MTPKAPELKTEKAVKRWTFEQLAVEDRARAAGEEMSSESASVALAREAHPVHSVFIQRTAFLDRVRRPILRAIKNKDAATFARLTKDDEVREWAMDQIWRPPGHQKGTPKRGQRFFTPDEREMLGYLAEVRTRVIALWERRGIRGERRRGLFPEQVAVEYLIGPEDDWRPVPANLWPGDPKDRSRTWLDRRDELIDLLEHFLKNKRTRPRRRKARL